MVSQNKHRQAVWLNLRLSRRPFRQSVIRGRAEKARRLDTINPSVSDIQQSQGSRNPRHGESRGLSAVPAPLSRGAGKPWPLPCCSRALGGTSPPSSRPKECTASFAGKNRSGSQTLSPTQRAPAAGGESPKPRGQRTDLARARATPPRAPAAAGPTRTAFASAAGRTERHRAKRRRERAGAGRPPQTFLRATTPSTQKPRETPCFPLAHFSHSPIAAGVPLHAR